MAFRLVLAGVAALVTLAAPAAAQSTRPAPCIAEADFEDPRGDQRVGFAEHQTPLTAQPNLDITGFFLNNDGKKVTANLAIADLSSTTGPPGSFGLVYRLIFVTPDLVRRFVDVSFSRLFGERIYYGHFDPRPVYDGTASGRVFREVDGLISLTLPRDAGGTPGTRLTEISWFAAADHVVLADADIVPDRGTLAYDGAACPPAA